MVGVRVVFGVVVSPGFGASILVIIKLVLGSSAMEPPEAHIHHLGPAGDNRFVGAPSTNGASVVSFQPLAGVSTHRFFDAARMIRMNLDFILPVVLI